MAHKKGLGSSKNGRDSNSKRLGVKVFAGQTVPAGSIIVRQKGTEFHPDPGAALGRDHTVFALVPGTVGFGRRRGKRVVTVAADGIARRGRVSGQGDFYDRASVVVQRGPRR